VLTKNEAAQLRSRFPIFRNCIYLNSCSQGALSDAVDAGLQEYVASWHGEGSPWEKWVAEYEESRRAFAALIGAQPHEVAVVTSVSAAISALASALQFDSRKGVVLGEFEFPTMGHVWLAQQTRGCEVNFVLSRDNEISLSSYDNAINNSTLLVGLSHVSFLNGFRSDVEAITHLAHARGALVLLDDYQDCGTRPVNVKSMGVDFYVAGTVKYLLGPSGLAFLYVREDLIHSLVPTTSGWFGQENPFTFDVKNLTLAESARRFEAGTPPMPSIYGANRAFTLLEDIRLETVASQVKEASRSLIEGCEGLGIRLKTPQSSKGPLVVLQSNEAARLVEILKENRIIVSSRFDGVRISFHVYNTPEDVSVLLSVLEKHLHLLGRKG
jgi:selenocysteine lyase/cysteine desulfurase